jgi:hypothetical protein
MKRRPETKAWRYVAHNVMEGFVLPDSKRRQRFFASQQQIQLIIAAAKEPYRTFYGLGISRISLPMAFIGLTHPKIRTDHYRSSGRQKTQLPVSLMSAFQNL